MYNFCETPPDESHKAYSSGEKNLTSVFGEESMFLDMILTGRKSSVSVKDLFRFSGSDTTIILNSQEENSLSGAARGMESLKWFVGVVKFWPERNIVTFHRRIQQEHLGKRANPHEAVSLSGVMYNVEVPDKILNVISREDINAANDLAWSIWKFHRVLTFEAEDSIRQSLRYYEKRKTKEGARVLQ